MSYSILKHLAEKYPLEQVPIQIKDIKRIEFNISIVLNSKRPSKLSICDIGGGIGLFSLGCAALGFKRVVLIDDFSDPVNHAIGNSVLDLHKSHSVEIFSRDVIEKGIKDISGTFDVITSFDSMEHWHNSPKKLFHEVFDKLNPKGIFVLGVPNCVNLRKRLTVPFGIGKWSQIQEWYDAQTFRGHVREPDIDDLLYIFQDMGLHNVKIYGRNWLGYKSENPLIRFLTQIVDYPLRLKPSLCSDIYVVGQKLSS